MKSTAQKIKQCTGLIGTSDVTPWEDQFLRDMEDRLIAYEGSANNGDRAALRLSDKQLDTLDRIHGKHFA